MKFDELYYQIRDLEEVYTESINLKKALSDIGAKLKSSIKDLQDKINKSAKEGKIKEAKDTAKKALEEIESNATKISKTIEDKLSEIKKRAQQTMSVKESADTERDKEKKMLENFLNDTEMLQRALDTARQGIDRNIGRIKGQIFLPDEDFDCSKLASSINDTMEGIDKLLTLQEKINNCDGYIEDIKERVSQIRKEEQAEIEAELKRKKAKKAAKMESTEEPVVNSIDEIKLTIYESARANDITDEEKELLMNLL